MEYTECNGFEMYPIGVYAVCYEVLYKNGHLVITLT